MEGKVRQEKKKEVMLIENDNITIYIDTHISHVHFIHVPIYCYLASIHLIW